MPSQINLPQKMAILNVHKGFVGMGHTSVTIIYNYILNNP